MKRNKAMVLSFILIFAIALSGCGSRDSEESNMEKQQTYSGEEGRITAYISGPEQMLTDIENAFEEERGDVLEVLAMGSGPLFQKVNTEAEAGAVQADIIWGAEPIAYMELQSKNLLQSYESPEAADLKPENKIGNGFFTLCNARYGVIVYNKENVELQEIPRSWQDLTKESWKNRIAIADARQSAMALALVTGLVQMNGDEWDTVQALKENQVILTQQNEQAIERVATGEVDIAIAPHDGVLRLIKKAKKSGVESPLAISWPEEGALSVQRAIAIIANRARPEVNTELCQEFIDFVISQQGQEIASKYGFISVRKEQEAVTGVPDNVKAMSIDWDKAATQAEELRNRFDSIMTTK